MNDVPANFTELIANFLAQADAAYSKALEAGVEEARQRAIAVTWKKAAARLEDVMKFQGQMKKEE